MSAVRRLCLAIAIGLAAGGGSPVVPAKSVPVHFADADSPAAVGLGERLYAGHCASCHGRYRQGQPLWQIIDAYTGRRAPALDDSGRIWQRSDEAIFHISKYGRYATASPGGVSTMPAFEDVLGDREILAVVAFIKARWPIGLRIAQAMLNPGFAGMPADADDTAWRLPPSCNGMIHRNAAAAR
jgi:S-disulfanyl-L-cysteine oxidoreductase SoxD